ncbi:MAG: hypothetical protein LBK66_07400, partial [Spirochaetaceae bacterium]|nr:hypothetical protein [Spirochaetaceae bacterium]
MKKSCNNMTSSVWVVLFTALAAVTALALCGGCAKKQSEIKLSAAEGTGEFGVYYAKLFSIEYLPDGVKLLSDYSGRRCLLVPRGVEAPDNFTSSSIEHDLLVFTPVKKALYTSTTQVSFLDVLEENDDAEYDIEENSLYDSVAAVTMPQDQWDLAPIEERMRDGKTAYIARNSMGTIDIESAITLQPDIIFAEPAVMGMGDNLALFEAAGLPYAVVCEWEEGENRASFEWIKFIAAFYNKDAEADAIFRQQLARLDELARLT